MKKLIILAIVLFVIILLLVKFNNEDFSEYKENFPEETVQRSEDQTDASNLSDEEKEALVERLRALGYLE